jgi:uncharacterized membrane protein YqaE (UPF0057 family)
MKNNLIFCLSIICSLILGSCATSNEVSGGGMLQKRKYNKGFYWNKNSNLKESAARIEEDQDVLKNEGLSSKKYSGSETTYSKAGDKTGEGNRSELLIDQTVEEGNLLAENTERNEVSNEVEEAAVPETVGTKNVNFTQGSRDFAKSDSKKKHSIPLAASVSTILLVILAIIIPPLAVFLFEGATNRFWIDLILALIGWGVGFWLLGGLGWVCGIVAIVYALLIVLNAI